MRYKIKKSALSTELLRLTRCKIPRNLKHKPLQTKRLVFAKRGFRFSCLSTRRKRGTKKETKYEKSQKEEGQASGSSKASLYPGWGSNYRIYPGLCLHTVPLVEGPPLSSMSVIYGLPFPNPWFCLRSLNECNEKNKSCLSLLLFLCLHCFAASSLGKLHSLWPVQDIKGLFPSVKRTYETSYALLRPPISVTTKKKGSHQVSLSRLQRNEWASIAKWWPRSERWWKGGTIRYVSS